MEGNVEVRLEELEVDPSLQPRVGERILPTSGRSKRSRVGRRSKRCTGAGSCCL